MDEWGAAFLRTVQNACQAACSRLGVKSSWPGVRDALVVGTDCSGAEAPIWSMRAMGLMHRHVFSCDIDPHVRKFIEHVCPPSGPIYSDMLGRDRNTVPAHDLYVCGFPCKPFSSLRRHSTKLLKEPAAKPFFEVVRMLKHHRPSIAVLENVMGIVTVMRTVLGYLKRITGYFIIVMPINCADLQTPVSRPRYYFVLVRQDRARVFDEGKLQDIAREVYGAATASRRGPLAPDFMLARACPAVQLFLQEQRRRAQTEASRSSGLSRISTPFDTCSLSTWRQVDVWKKVTAAARVKSSGAQVIADVSQSVERSREHMAGISPTLTPGGVVVVQAAGRPLAPIEKLLFHGFPVHRMSIPRDTSAQTLGSLGGNTMHLKSVGLAILVGVSLVDWPLSSHATASDTKSVVLFPLDGAAAKEMSSRQVVTRPMKRRRES